MNSRIIRACSDWSAAQGALNRLYHQAWVHRDNPALRIAFAWAILAQQQLVGFSAFVAGTGHAANDDWEPAR